MRSHEERLGRAIFGDSYVQPGADEGPAPGQTPRYMESGAGKVVELENDACLCTGSVTVGPSQYASGVGVTPVTGGVELVIQGVGHTVGLGHWEALRSTLFICKEHAQAVGYEAGYLPR